MPSFIHYTHTDIFIHSLHPHRYLHSFTTPTQIHHTHTQMPSFIHYTHTDTFIHSQHYKATILASKATITSGLHCERCWEAWDTTCGHKAKDITPSTAWRRGTERGNAQQYSLKWSESTTVKQTKIRIVSKVMPGNFLISRENQIQAFSHSM